MNLVMPHPVEITLHCFRHIHINELSGVRGLWPWGQQAQSSHTYMRG